MISNAHKINFGSEQNQIVLLHAVKARCYPIIELITEKTKQLDIDCQEIKAMKSGRGALHLIIDCLCKQFDQGKLDFKIGLEKTQPGIRLDTHNSPVKKTLLTNMAAAPNASQQSFSNGPNRLLKTVEPAQPQRQPSNDVDVESPSLLDDEFQASNVWNELEETLNSHRYDNSELSACKKILHHLLRNGFCFNKTCNQLYTPFHDAVRHGNAALVAYLLQNFMKRHPKIDSKSLININQSGGFAQNSVFHLAASRTKYEIVFELDKY